MALCIDLTLYALLSIRCTNACEFGRCFPSFFAILLISHPLIWKEPLPKSYGQPLLTSFWFLPCYGYAEAYASHHISLLGKSTILRYF